MNILAINSAFSEAHIAVEFNQTNKFLKLDANAKSSESILPNIDKILQSLDAKIADISHIGIVVGPGSFTGVRIGVALAKGFLSVFKNMQAVAVNSLDLMAFEYVQKNAPECDFCCVQNALSGRFFVAKYNKLGQKISKDELLAELPDGPKIGLDFEKLTEVDEWIALNPEKLLEYVKFLIKTQQFVSGSELSPVYIRLSQAEENLYKKQVVIQKLTKDDLPAVEEISNQEFGANGWQIGLFEQELGQENHYSYVGKVDGKTVCFLFVMETFGEVGKEFNILNIATKKSEQHKGFATKMLNFLSDEAKKMDVKSLWLEVRENNLNAIEFYQHFGFKTDYIRKKYYSNGDNALVMSKKI